MTPLVRNAICYLSERCFFYSCYDSWKMNKFPISMKFHFKKGKIYFQSLISPSYHELHCPSIVHMSHMEPIFQDLHFYCTKKIPKNHNQFCHFVMGVKPTSWCLLRPWFPCTWKQSIQQNLFITFYHQTLGPFAS